MAASPLSTKRVQVSKATATIVGTIAAASFVTVFSLIASQALLSQRSYQARVIAGKETALKQLKDNIKAVDVLKTQYQAFVGTSQNVIGGNPTGSGERDGDNARIVLDALPSKYDFPALATSLEKILSGGGYKTVAISGSDDEVAQDTNSKSPDPQPIAMPFQVGLGGSYSQMQSFIGVLEHSIRPVQIKTLALTGSEGQMNLTISADTFYQPSKSLSITTKVVK